MLKNFLKNFLSLFKSRILICALIFAGFSIVLIHRLYNLQIVNGEDYLNTFTYRIQKNVELPARRGTIYDCNGVPLAYDKLAYTISIGDSALLTDNDTRNAMISKLLDLADACGDTLALSFSSAFSERVIQRGVFRRLAADGIPVRVETNGVFYQ